MKTDRSLIFSNTECEKPRILQGIFRDPREFLGTGYKILIRGDEGIFRDRL